MMRSKDARLSDSLRNALVRKLREWTLLLIGRFCVGGWKRMLSALEGKLPAKSIVSEKNRFSRSR